MINRKIFLGRSLKDVFIAIGPTAIVAVILLLTAYFYLEPAPPNHLIITTGDEGDYEIYAKQYREILKKEGVDLEIRTSNGPVQNLQRLQDEASNIDAGFVQDGVGSPEDQPALESLGSLYYEPIWVFYRGTELNKFSQMKGKRIGVGRQGRGTRLLALNLLKESGVDEHNTKLVSVGAVDALKALRANELDAAFFLLPPDDSLIREMVNDPNIQLMNVSQAEAISRQIPYFHHLLLPQGSLDLKNDIPKSDINLIAPTATLLVRDDLHPALAFLLLKAAEQVHNGPGLFEKRGEFPSAKDDQFPLSEDAKQFYKSGGPFWQRYLPYWIAAWIDRFILIVIPILAILIPLIRLIPTIYKWRIRSRIYQRYGELKFLETRLSHAPTESEYKLDLKELDAIEKRVNDMRVPLEFVEHIYSLRGHIQFVRDRLNDVRRSAEKSGLNT